VIAGLLSFHEAASARSTSRPPIQAQSTLGLPSGPPQLPSDPCGISPTTHARRSSTLRPRPRVKGVRNATRSGGGGSISVDARRAVTSAVATPHSAGMRPHTTPRLGTLLSRASSRGRSGSGTTARNGSSTGPSSPRPDTGPSSNRRRGRREGCLLIGRRYFELATAPPGRDQPLDGATLSPRTPCHSARAVVPPRLGNARPKIGHPPDGPAAP
jgi:hypothetical protein